jgi:Meiotically Up-regulated Gene 113 (MUG113) protein
MQYLYLIESQHFCKIGIANDVQSRLAQLSTGNPFELKLLACYSYENAEVVERSIHQRFAEKRARGEWFALGEQDLSEFHQICLLLGGIPSAVSPTAEEEEVEEAEQLQETDDILGGIKWRLERRNDRNPPGFAIFQRGGDKVYLGYVGKTSLKDPEHPTIEEIEAVIARNRRGEHE